MSKKKSAVVEKKFFSKYRKPMVPVPNLVENQVASHEWFLRDGIADVFKEFSPIEDYSGKKFKLEFTELTVGEAKHDEYYAKANKLSFEAPLKARVRLTNKVLGTSKEQEMFLTDVPLMTPHGTFVTNGIERVVVAQLARSYGVFFTSDETKKGIRFGAKIIPARGAWIEIESDMDNLIHVRIDKKRKFHITSLLRVFGLTTNEKILTQFTNLETQAVIKACLEKDSVKTADDAYLEMHKKLRDGELATVENAREFIESVFSPERYDLSRVGRFRFQKYFSLSLDEKELERKTLSLEDLVMIIDRMVFLNNTPGSKEDDIDHLGSRRVRYVGELFQQKVRVGMAQMKRNIQDRMSTIDGETVLPVNIVNPRPLQARIKEFFATNQLSQFMHQENPLDEIEHLRILSALGPGGLTRERAGFEVRDVHPSHYGRLCPIHTPEGPNIGLIMHMSVYARTNEYGMLETPYAKVVKGKITDEIIYLNALEEEKYTVAHAGVAYDAQGKIVAEKVAVRIKGAPHMVTPSEVDFIDIATNQALSVATSCIPFLEHNDANRALMGSNMQKQATPCLIPQAPIVATGMEEQAARDTGRVVIAKEDGEVTGVDGARIVIKGTKSGKDVTYALINFARTNNSSLFHQRPIVSLGDSIKKGDAIADSSSTDKGQLALGQNVRVAFMCWNGQNYEDAIILSQRLVKNSIFSSVRVAEYECIVRDTKLGEEVTTHDIPNVGESKLKNLDEDGIVRVGAEVRENDILVGKITPKGETELTPEERLLRSIFGEKARDVKDTSLRLEHGKRGRVIGVKVFSRERGDQLESGILKKIYIEVAQVRNISVGDKLAGRHGNKGVISTILPEEDMPYTEDGEPVDVILTPLGVPSRMNLGQILELHLGRAANTLNYQAIVPPFGGASADEIQEELKKAGFNESGKMKLYDGRTGEAFEQDIAVGYMYVLKLHHMVEDKIHMRSVGPYSLITQQPLGGKSQGGGQRFGEMEVWALEGYGAAYTLREMLTIKSDDIQGRSQAFDSLIKGQPIQHPHVPASFNVLLAYLRGLSLDVSLTNVEIPNND